MEVIVPIVHLNGTSRTELIDQRTEALHAIMSAEEALSRTSPNGRDFYPVDGLLQKAQAQHLRRALLLKSLREELESELEQLVDGATR